MKRGHVFGPCMLIAGKRFMNGHTRLVNDPVSHLRLG